ncbi:MAG: hypothetical protein ACTHMQ_13120 [Protaetiibacter sp.]
MNDATSTPRFELPGKWGRINLRSEASIQRSIRRVLDEVTRRRDDLVEPRAELRRRFQKAAEIAREGGATDFYVAFQLVPTIPLPAWVAVFTPEIDSTDFASLGLGELTQFLDRGMSAWGDPDAAVRSSAAGPDDEIHAVRHSWRRVADVVEGEVEQRFEFVEADYWLAARDPNRIALLTFSTALADYEEEMLALFDAVVSTIRWPAPR